MGKGRKPCCDKAGVKRGPWSEAEDLKLVSFIQNHGHNNWRALPKLAGLARCGKSCRLRWVNYLRPDLKRGNFTPQEEEIILKLHEVLGNKWSKIASHFPGRTDNEIKNVWNTHLKKRIKAKKSSSSTTSSASPPLNEVLNGSDKDISQQALTQQTSPMEEEIIVEQPASSSSTTCYSSQSSFSDHQMSDFNPGLDKGNASDTNMAAFINDENGEGIVDVDKMIKGDLVEEPIEIPFEPNLDLWDLLDTEEYYSNSADSEVLFNEPIDHQAAPDPINPIPENDNNNYSSNNYDYSNNREGDGSWWWLVYLENELGLAHNESTPQQQQQQQQQQATSGNSVSDELLFKEEQNSYFQISPSHFT